GEEEGEGAEKRGQQDAELRGGQVQFVLQQRRRDGEIAAINVVDQSGQRQQRDHAVGDARSWGALVVDWGGQVWLADILHAGMGCCKRLLRVVALVFRNGKARKGSRGRLKDPAAKAGPFTKLTRLPAAPAVDDARLDPGI